MFDKFLFNPLERNIKFNTIKDYKLPYTTTTVSPFFGKKIKPFQRIVHQAKKAVPGKFIFKDDLFHSNPSTGS